MKRFWNEIELPIGVSVYNGANTQYIVVNFQYNGRKREEKFVDDGYSKIDADYIAEAGRAVAKIKREIKSKTFIFESWFPHSRTLSKKRQLLNLSIPPVGTPVKFADFVEIFIPMLFPAPKKKERSGSTLYGYLKIGRQLGRFFANYNIDEIGADEIESWITSLEGFIVKATLRKRWSVFQMILSGAKAKKYIKVNPVKDVEFDFLVMNWLAKQEKTSAFDELELKLVMSFADDFERALFIFWAETGLRTSEIICLEWSDVLWDECKLDVNKAKVVGIKDMKQDNTGKIATYKVAPIIKDAKSNAGDRYVPLSDVAIQMLRLQQTLVPHDLSDPIFVNPNTTLAWYSDNPIRGYWYRLLNKAGIDNTKNKLNPYKFRNTFCVREIKNNVDLLTIKDKMGHADLSPVINNYGNSAPTKKRRK